MEPHAKRFWVPLKLWEFRARETWDVRMYALKRAEGWSYMATPQKFGNLGLQRKCVTRRKGTFSTERRISR
jgi:hypothetical protein